MILLYKVSFYVNNINSTIVVVYWLMCITFWELYQISSYELSITNKLIFFKYWNEQ